MASSGLKKMLIHMIFQHWRCHGVGVSCNFWTLDGFLYLIGIKALCFFWLCFEGSYSLSYFGRCCCLVLADVVAIILMWYMLQPPGRCCACIVVADVFANLICVCGRCCCHIFLWLMLLPFDVSYCGRCCCHHSLSG